MVIPSRIKSSLPTKYGGGEGGLCECEVSTITGLVVMAILMERREINKETASPRMMDGPPRCQSVLTRAIQRPSLSLSSDNRKSIKEVLTMRRRHLTLNDVLSKSSIFSYPAH